MLIKPKKTFITMEEMGKGKFQMKYEEFFDEKYKKEFDDISKNTINVLKSILGDKIVSIRLWKDVCCMSVTIVSTKEFLADFIVGEFLPDSRLKNISIGNIFLGTANVVAKIVKNNG